MKTSTTTRFFNKSDVASIVATIPTGHAYNISYVTPTGKSLSVNCRSTIAETVSANFITVYNQATKVYNKINTDLVTKISAEKRQFIIK